jgi:hypothetical protein
MEIYDDKLFDNVLDNRVRNYVNEKCAKLEFEKDHGPLYFIIRGMNSAMWKRVVKPELLRMASEHLHYLHIKVENPKMGWIEFEFVQIRTPMPREVVPPVTPLTDMEIVKLRQLLEDIETGKGQWSKTLQDLIDKAKSV